MASVTVLPSLALVVGAAYAHRFPASTRVTLPLLCVCLFMAVLAAWRSVGWLVLAMTMAGAGIAGSALADHDRERSLRTSLRDVLDERLGGFLITVVTPGRSDAPIVSRMLVVEDASVRDGFVSVNARVESVRFSNVWLPTDGGVTLSIGGSAAQRADEWRRGRLIEAPVTYRRPSRYLNAGVPDFERDLALGGTTLFGSVKSGLLIDLVRHGSRFDEWAAAARAHVRQVIARDVGRHSPLSSAIVAAVLIGDRTGLSDDVRNRLQAAGTYHVIAISGGNIAILAGLCVGLFTLTGLARRPSAGFTLLVLIAYAAVITSGPSVWRATLMAAIYLVARVLDHRAPARQSIALAALILTVIRPLEVVDAGFLLTFGATGALLEVIDRTAHSPRRPAGMRSIVATVLASLAIEIVLLPIGASTFSRVTAAGLVLNLAAVPTMAVTQVAGMVIVATAAVPAISDVAGWVAHGGALVLVESARVVDFIPWLTARVPPPPWWLVTIYYVALVVAVACHRSAWRAGAITLLGIGAVCIVTGVPAIGTRQPGALRLTTFDVGQGESLLLELPSGRALLIDTGGAPFGSAAFDIGARVLAPALWRRGIRSLDSLLITHADPDHIGGARSVLTDFRPRIVWDGIPVPGNAPLAELRAVAQRSSVPMRSLRAGERLSVSGVQLRVLHPQGPDWERQKVRNDDSVVLEVSYRDVAMLLTGDIGAGIERQILPQLTPARIRVLKVAHHGSRTSSSSALLETWKPGIALISVGRGNTFGHPAPVVMQRLESTGARVYRTDLDGEITLTTDGHQVTVTTYRDPLATRITKDVLPSRRALSPSWIRGPAR